MPRENMKMIRFHTILTLFMLCFLVVGKAVACDDVECPQKWVWSDAEGTCIEQPGEVS